MNVPSRRFPFDRGHWLLFVLILSLLLAVPALAKGRPEAVQHGRFEISLPASVAGNVTGGDARLHVAVPEGVPAAQVKILVNGEDVADRFSLIPDTHILSGVVDGLRVGKNQVLVNLTGPSRVRVHPARMELFNYPITGPVFSGPHQLPFVCTVQKHGLGQPLVDNDSYGYPVYGAEGEVIGYSKNCSAETVVTLIYKSTDGSWKPFDPTTPRPADMAQTTTLEGKTVDFVVRWERGTINRFIYSIAMLAPDATGPADLTRSGWNGRLIYHFQGGVAIGHDQGDPSGSRMLYEVGLARGYAIAYSTGNKTGTHYNLVLGGETALMVKEHFVELYDAPLYTVGLGGSGGGIQQYIYGQNHPGLLDAAIPQYSYPDMVTQAIHVGDCELLEFYMSVLDAGNPRWQTWSNRSLLEGLNASDMVFNPYTGQAGNTECINGWRGLSPLALNPNYGFVDGQEQIVPQSAVAGIKWTHFQDLVNQLGVAPDGFARNYWDNVGVQYGLESVAAGEITPEEFLRLNATVGGWKNEPEMVQEGSPFYPPGVIDPDNWDPWSSRNQVYSVVPDVPAPRTEGDTLAMNAAYESGLVFVGDIDLPIIDWRHYLEPELDMHNSHQSFASRQRILEHRGDYNNQVIWFTDIGPNGPEYDQTPEALTVMDQWMLNILANPEAGVSANKPPLAVDRCFEKDGSEIAAGPDVWDGILNEEPEGACTQRFPLYRTSRIVAGGPLKGGVFKCELKPVAQAVADGDYGVWSPNETEEQQLEQIFPDGVCDFSQPDAGLPQGW